MRIYGLKKDLDSSELRNNLSIIAFWNLEECFDHSESSRRKLMSVYEIYSL